MPQCDLSQKNLLTGIKRSMYLGEIIGILEKRLNDKGKNWRHVMKVSSAGGGKNLFGFLFPKALTRIFACQALTILLYCAYEGSEQFVHWLQRKLYLIKTLQEFRYADVRNIDQGAPIRSKAKILTDLLEDESKLNSEKQNYKRIQESMGKPGILDLSLNASTNNGGNNSTTYRGRMTLDLSSSSSSTSPVSPVSPMNPKRQMWPTTARERLSLEGRYSLSFPPLHSIQEEYY